MALIYLGASVALLGAGSAGTASAAASGPVSGQRGTAVHDTTVHTAAAHRPAALHRAALHTAALHTAALHTAALHTAALHTVALREVDLQPLISWNAVAHVAARHRRGPLAPSDRLLPTAVSGPQAFMPITPAREANATTIVRQALLMHMGLRSAVIAVATAMQESTLLDLDYGDQDSLGLFQQRPSCGWGTPAQVTNPQYASDAFLNALRQYQHRDPSWATQPLWEAAQGVQNSGFPYAYAKWEDQAAHIVGAVWRHAR
jgi:hypothetical protein